MRLEELGKDGRASGENEFVHAVVFAAGDSEGEVGVRSGCDEALVVNRPKERDWVLPRCVL